MFVRKGLKNMPWTNTLAYFTNLQITDVKSFIILVPGVNKKNENFVTLSVVYNILSVNLIKLYGLDLLTLFLSYIF